MFDRHLESYIREIAQNYKAITMIGPRQAGKSTLAKKLFPDFDYCSLEEPDLRELALNDPRSFLGRSKNSMIVDEIQRAPDLVSYLQSILDDKADSRKWILTGSDSLLLSDKISQSLAGRTRLITVLPLSYSEIPKKLQPKSIDEALFTGGYPRIYNEGLRPSDWLSDYFQTYVEKDIRSSLNIANLLQFEKFVKLLAGRTGQLVNYSSFENDVGVSHPTASSWISVLEASCITFKLSPHFKNFSKRIIKSPKNYFWDTGLLCNLLHIRNLNQLESHPLRGQIFENWVISEFAKLFYWRGETPPLYFWRDQSGHEIDLIVDNGSELIPVEIKASQTFSENFLKVIQWFNKLQNKDLGMLVYGGTEALNFKGIDLVPWDKISRISI